MMKTGCWFANILKNDLERLLRHYRYYCGAFRCFSFAWMGHCTEFSGNISAILVGFDRHIVSPLNSANFSTWEDSMDKMNFGNPNFFGFGFPIGLLTSGGLRSPKGTPLEYMLSNWYHWFVGKLFL